VHPIYLVDAFADTPFTGNSAGVCILDEPAEERWMQLVALEMNQAETAFLVNTDKAAYSLRWFTPTIEVELCGHATLASGHILWETRRETPGVAIEFDTASGVLVANPAGEFIELDFPETPPTQAQAPPGLVDALGIEPVSVHRSSFDYLLEYPKDSLVRTMKPNFDKLRAVETRGVIVTAPSEDPAFDYVVRFFAPASGVLEDPATGSAQCALAPFWSKKLGIDVLKCFQASPRGGWFEVECSGKRVFIRGKAFTTMEGSLK